MYVCYVIILLFYLIQTTALIDGVLSFAHALLLLICICYSCYLSLTLLLLYYLFNYYNNIILLLLLLLLILLMLLIFNYMFV